MFVHFIVVVLQDSYAMFGVQFHADDHIIRPLESQRGLRRLYPQNYDHKRELKKLNHSILANFLDLLDILIKAPDSHKRGEKIDDLTLLFIHMHHLINEFRPHQARETLRVMMEVQQRQRLETAERFQKHLEKVQEMLRTSLSALPDDTELDSKLLIKMEPMDIDMGQSSVPMLPHIKQEVKIKQEPDADADEENGDCNTLDKMMCDIVDTM